MAEKLRFSIGIMGNAASFSLYAAPVLTFARVIKMKSTGEFSCVPYIVTMFNCFLGTWYGLPIVSQGWENLTMVTINGMGIFFEIAFVLIYFWFTNGRGKVKVAAIALPLLLIFAVTAALSAFVLHDHRHRKELVGSVLLVASVSMYSSPLVVMKRVIETKSVEFMPFYLSFFSFLASTLWMIYGLLARDLFIAGPSFLATPLSILQLVLYFKYRKNDIKREPTTIKGEQTIIKGEPTQWDVEKNDEKPMQVQLACPENVANGKI